MHDADLTHPRTAVRSPAHAAAALACVLALVSALATAGCAASPASLGPVTHLTGHPR